MKAFFNHPCKNNGFTLFEIAIVIAILGVLAAVSIPAFLSLKEKIDLDNSANEVATVLRLAQSRTVASEDGSKYGVYFDTASSPHKYVLFKGNTYATRDTAADVTYYFEKTVEFDSVVLGSVGWGGGTETAFEKLTGGTEKVGTVIVRLKADTSQTKTVYLSSSGVVDFTAIAPASDASRVKDSRHVHFAYSRVINTASESITLTFNGSVNEVIPMSQYVNGGVFSWSGTVDAGGEEQVVEIATHRLNNPDTEFSIHRDKRYNTKALDITLSGDLSGNIMEYAANGSTTTFDSIYVSNVAWQ